MARRRERLRLRALQRVFSSSHYYLARPATSERGAAYIYIYIYIYIEQASLMHRRAIVLAFLPAALEVLAFSFVKCSSSEAFRSMCRRHEYACVSCLCKSCVVLSCAVLCCVVGL